MKELLQKNSIRKLLSVALALLLWQAGAVLLDLPLLLVPPLEVLKRLLTLVQEADFWRTLLFSFSRIVLGFAIAFALGCLLGVLSGKWPLLETLLWPYVITIKTVPVASFIILSLFFLSARRLSTFISFLMVFPVIYSNVLEGIRSTDRELLEMGQVFRIPWGRRLGYIYLPHLKPFLFSACFGGPGHELEVRRGGGGHRRGLRVHRRKAVRVQDLLHDGGPAGLDRGHRAHIRPLREAVPAAHESRLRPLGGALIWLS